METRLVGAGLYTPAEAGRLLRMTPGKISRWIRGHTVNGVHYSPLWKAQVDLGDRGLFLGFRDLMETRVANAFINLGISAIRMRSAIRVAQEVIHESHPLATNRFRTDGREIFLHVIEKDEDGVERERLLNLFKKQYEFHDIVEPILKTVEFGENGAPLQWWPEGRRMGIVVDPGRSFGAPIDNATSVPTSVLADSARALGEAETMIAYDVPRSSVSRAVAFEERLEPGLAA